LRLKEIADIVARKEFLTPIASICNGEKQNYVLQPQLRPIFLAEAARQFPSPIIVITADEARSHLLTSDLNAWADDLQVVMIPALDQPALSQGPASSRTTNERAARLYRLLEASQANENGSVFVMSVEAAMRKLPTSMTDMAELLNLSVGDVITHDRLVKALLAFGFRRTPLVEKTGEFSVRGGIVDIYPIEGDDPVRMDFFGDEIDSIQRFDVNTQLSKFSIGDFRLIPVSEIPISNGPDIAHQLGRLNTDNMRLEDKERWRNHINYLEAGISFDSSAFYLASGLEPWACVLDYCKDCLIAIDDYDKVLQKLKEYVGDSDESLLALIESGELPRQTPSPLVDYDAFFCHMDDSPIKLFSSENPSFASHSMVESFRSIPLFQSRLHEMVETVKSGQNTTILVSEQLGKLKGPFIEYDSGFSDIATVNCLGSQSVLGVKCFLSQGWSYEKGNIQIVTDAEIFGRSKAVQRRKKISLSDGAFLSDISPGDFVVHIEHGIGQFEKIVKLAEIGGEKEYLLLQYAGEAKVYVPVDQVERVQKYISSGGYGPKLNKLGSADWERAKSKAKSSARDIAGQLIQLYASRKTSTGYAFPPDSTWQLQLEDAFEFVETLDQASAIDDVKGDMESESPMDRLVCGDVGYGKTEVAVRAAFKAIDAGKQVAILVPTTILAQQHAETFSSRMKDFPITIEVLSRFRTSADQRSIIKRLNEGDIDLIIGTHRVLGKDINFRNLGLVIIDEEQRFGVAHKEKLKSLRVETDVLTLSATPIPRTLHMALTGLREVSLIETPPLDRLAVKTYVTSWDDEIVREAILRELRRGGQIYVVHNRIKTIAALAERLQRLVPEASFSVAHGKMAGAELERIMTFFGGGNADVLICTAIIESGMDLPNVNTLIVDDSWMFGLSQLYQLRGRVGRSNVQGYAYMLHRPGHRLTDEAKQRLEALMEASELGAGFRLAMKDLEIRGAGDLLGADQSGFANSVGFDLYTRMITEAVQLQRGESVPAKVAPAAVDLPLDAYLPEEYVGSYRTKIREYQRLASIRTPDDANRAVNELLDRFGNFPKCVQNLCYIMKVRAYATSIGLLSITHYDGELLIKFTSGHQVHIRTVRNHLGKSVRIKSNRIVWDRFEDDKYWRDRLMAYLQAVCNMEYRQQE